MAPPTTADAAGAFVLEKAKEYWEGEDEDGILWADFEYDFRGWTEPTFDLVSSKSLTKLRDNLKNRGVFIKTGSAYKIAKTLTATTLAGDDPQVDHRSYFEVEAAYGNLYRFEVNLRLPGKAWYYTGEAPHGRPHVPTAIVRTT